MKVGGAKQHKSKRVVIIGAGFGGLSAAAYLAQAGYQVKVLEKNEGPGGRAALLRKNGFNFDMGPSWYMMPEIFEKWFGQFKQKPSDFYRLKKLKPQYKLFFTDRSTVLITGNRLKDEALFESLESGSALKLRQYLSDAQLKYDLSMKTFLSRQADDLVGNLKDFDVWKNLWRLFAPYSVHHLVKKNFSSKKLQQILEFNLVFLGCHPAQAPGFLSLMAYVDLVLGVWYPQGGFYEVVKAMEKVAKKQGAKFYYHQPVKKLITTNALVTKVVTSKQTFEADFVISNADMTHTEKLIDNQSLKQYSDRYWEKKVWSPSGLLLYLGIKGKLDNLSHHNLYFDENWEQHFADIFDQPKWPDKPSIYVNMPTATDPSVAPAGHENLMVLVPVAVNLPDTPAWRKEYSRRMIDYLEISFGIKLKKRIVYQEVFTVKDFMSRYNSYGGNALGGMAHNLLQNSFLRPANNHRHLKNLFFAGAGTFPGIGVPTSIISGQLAAQRVMKK